MCAPAWRTAAAIVVMFTLSACGDDGGGSGDETPSQEESNPASEFCVDQGGEVDIVDEDDGQVGYCVLPDGSRVDEWEYFRENS